MNKKPKKKKIIIVGSDSAISENLQERILQKNDFLTTISRRKNSKFKNKEHFCTDLSDIGEVKALSKKIEGTAYDVFIYCAGSFNPKKITEHEDNQILNELNINLTSAVLLTVPIIKSMKSNKGGMILYIGSSSSYAGFKNTSIYCSSKHGLLGFSRSLADEYRELGIRIACISPASINTKMSKPLHSTQNPLTFIDPNEVSVLLEKIIYQTPTTMWQEEIILKRLSYQ
tara:strand:+ start:9021 stop:9707 length:687 start_codon:yes stop_codon:yes gene_type:complete